MSHDGMEGLRRELLDAHGPDFFPGLATADLTDPDVYAALLERLEADVDYRTAMAERSTRDLHGQTRRLRHLGLGRAEARAMFVGDCGRDPAEFEGMWDTPLAGEN